jgi:hypothetical protein
MAKGRCRVEDIEILKQRILVNKDEKEYLWVIAATLIKILEELRKTQPTEVNNKNG